MPRIRVLIADDHPMVIAGIRAFLADHPHIDVVGEAIHGNDAVEKARALQPDIVLMDISMPSMNGIEATRILLSELPSLDIIILTMHDDKEYIRQIINCGAKGYLLKNAPQEDILTAIDAVYRGGAYFSPEVSTMLLQVAHDKRTDEIPSLYELSFQEQEVLTLLAQEYSNKEIADQLCLSVRTIEKHREHIMQKLDIHTLGGLIKFAIKHGLIEN
jgi:DNA-binding NarL/FixJ family response regulator